MENVLYSVINPAWMFLIFPIFGLVLLIRWYVLSFDENLFKKSIVPYTKFLYEDGNTYYFRVIDRNSNDYHYIQCYKRTWFGMYRQIGNYELIDAELGSRAIKREIQDIMRPYVARLEGWDGVVGDVPEWVKREERFKKLFKEK